MKLGMSFNILIKEEDNVFVAHCLELDLVATAQTIEQVKEDIFSIIRTQVEFAFDNDNMENLYHSAPKKVWQEFYSCKDSNPEVKTIEIGNARKRSTTLILPPLLNTTTCIFSPQAINSASKITVQTS